MYLRSSSIIHIALTAMIIFHSAIAKESTSRLKMDNLREKLQSDTKQVKLDQLKLKQDREIVKRDRMEMMRTHQNLMREQMDQKQDLKNKTTKPVPITEKTPIP